MFVPIAFLGGLTGELYRQFAITISIAVAISGVVALTLTPSLCVMMLKREHKQPGRFFTAFNNWFTRVTHRYTSGVIWMMRRGAIALLLFGGMVLIAAGLWRATPGLAGARRGPGLLHRRGDPARRRVAAAHRQGRQRGGRHPDARTRSTRTWSRSPASTSSAAAIRNNAATIFVTQKPWDERSVNTQQLVGEFFMKTGHIKEGLVLAFAPPRDLRPRHGGRLRGCTSRTAARAGRREMQQALQGLLGRLNSDPMLGGAQTLWRANVPQLFVDVDREKAKALGVPIDDVFATLSATLGSYYVNDFNKYGRTWQVLMSAEPQYRNRPDAVGNMWVRSDERRDGAAVVAGRPCATRRAPTRSTASTTCRR